MFSFDKETKHLFSRVLLLYTVQAETPPALVSACNMAAVSVSVYRMYRDEVARLEDSVIEGMSGYTSCNLCHLQ